LTEISVSDENGTPRTSALQRPSNQLQGPVKRLGPAREEREPLSACLAGRGDRGCRSRHRRRRSSSLKPGKRPSEGRPFLRTRSDDPFAQLEAGQTPFVTEVQESRRSRAGRHGRRTALYLAAALLTTALVLLVILIVQNTGRVRVGWIFGHSRVSLVFLILFASILGWIAGIATSIVFRRRTRRS